MKKLLLFTAFAVFVFSTTQAQEFRIGAKAGLNVASLSGDSSDGSTTVGELASRTSFHLGGLVEIPLMGRFSLQPEILYSSEGSKSDWSFLAVNEDTATKLDYIRVPVLAKFYIIEGLSAEAGPVLGVLVSAKYEGTYNGEDVNNDIKDGYNTMDIGLGIGASYRLNMGVFFSLRYNKGLSNILKDSEVSAVTYKNQSNVFQVSAGYSF